MPVTKTQAALAVLAGALAATCARKDPPTMSADSAGPPSSAAPSSAAPAAAGSAARASVRQLQHEALKLSGAYEWDEAREKIVKAQALAPDDDELKKALAVVDEQIATRVAGKWFKRTEKDAMTDRENVFVTLPATADLSGRASGTRPALVARCIKGQPEVLVQVEAVVDGDLSPAAKVQYRFDSDAPQTSVTTVAEGMKGLFFREPGKWFDRLVEHAAGKFVVEVPLFGRVAEGVTFELRGAEVAIPAVKAACAK